MRHICTRALLALLAVAGCAAPDGEAPSVELDPGEPALRGSFAMMPPELERAPESPGATELLLAPARTVLYMNRRGGTFTPGPEDSRSNRSSILDENAVLPPWEPGDEAWAQVMTCVRGQFAPFNVEVTDVDPGNMPHVESVVAGRASDIGYERNVGGLSPFMSDCRVIPNAIVFTFAAALPDNPQLVCEIVAQEVGHSFGLDHQYLCEDPMSYLDGCGPKSYQDVSSACGEYEARPCRVEGHYDCGADTQNSYAKLAQRLGMRDGSPAPPSVAIVSPVEGAEVAPGFAVAGEASSALGAVSVELRIDGVAVDTAATAPFELTAPVDLEAGAHVVEVVARDGLAESSHSIAVHVSGDAAPEAPDEAAVTDPDAAAGCSASGGAGADLALVLAAAALFLRRRRRAAS